MTYTVSMTVLDALENPLRAVRLDRGLSLDRLAHKAGCSRQLIIRAEQAVYKDPPPTLLKAVLDLDDDLDEQVLVANYHAYQTFTRKANYGRLSVTFPVGLANTLHPFVEWRIRSGIRARIGISKLYCVHPALIHKFESMPWLVQSVPGELRVALLESGYRTELLDHLEKMYYTFKEARVYRRATING